MSHTGADAGSSRWEQHDATSDGPQGVGKTTQTVQAEQAGKTSADEPPIVLVVEDEGPIAEALGYVIMDAGYVPVIAAHGQQALELVRQRHPALIITDLMMPYMDGEEFIATLRANPPNNGHDGQRTVPPIVLMTAVGGRRLQEIGADEVLRKPFNIDDVDELLHRYLGPQPPE